MTVEQHLPALQVAVPLLTAPVVALLREARLAWLAAFVTSVMTFAISVALAGAVLDGAPISYAMGGWAAPYGIELRVDAMSAILLLVISGASTIALVGGRASLFRQIGPERLSLFLAAWLLAVAGLVGIMVSGDAFNIFVFMEISSLATYILVSGGPKRRALVAVFKYLIIGTVGATFYLIGVGLLYMMTGTLNIADIASRLQDVGDARPVLVAAGFITIGLALKSAIYPLHAWMPNAYTFAPHAVTAFIAACSTKTSLYVLLRMDISVFGANIPGHQLHFAYLLMPLAVLGIVYGSLAAIFERDVKRILALSSIAQIGYILLGASLLSEAGLTASMLHMFNHALAKLALFLAVACLGMHFFRLRLSNLGGVGRRMPWTMTAFAIAGLSLIGVPGTAGFVSKWALISAAMGEGGLGVALVILIVISSLLSVVYIGRVVECLWYGEASERAATVREAPIGMLVVTWMAVLANVWFGIDSSVSNALASTAAEAITRTLP